MLKKFVLSFWALMLFSGAANAVQYAYQINFTNKNGTASFSDSLSFLSHRSLARRAIQGILLDSTDLPVSRAYVDSVLHLTGGKIHVVSKWLNLCVILVADSASIHALDGITFISGKKLVGVYSDILHKNTKLNTHSEPATPEANKTNSGAVYYGNPWPQTAMVNGNYLHELGYKGAGKLIVIVDGGFMYADVHPGFDSLRATGRIVDVHNFAIDTSYVYDYDTHGMQMLSTMAAYVPNTYVGSAPLASYALYVTEAPFELPIELLNMLAGAERADSLGADIISSSLGYNTFDAGFDNLVYEIDLDGKSTIAAKAANMATKKGILFVTSAGNDGAAHILTPSDADSALTIGNVDIAGNSPSNSGYGPNAAGQVKPDVCTLGQPGQVCSPGSSGFGQASGTSIATPQIAGWAACLWEASPTATPAQLRKAINQCASKYNDPGIQIGYGIPDFRCAANALKVVDTIPRDGVPMMVTPNPMGGVMTITYTLSSSQNAEMRLIDVAGRTAMSFTAYLQRGINQQVSYDVSNLPAAMYFLKVALPNFNQVIKVVKR